MRLTVGPLPSAVYWRRRAVVLGVLLLVVAGLYAACSGSGSDADSNKTAGSSTPTVGAVDPDQGEPDPTQNVLTPESEAPSGGDQGGTDPLSTDPALPPQAPADTVPCGDGEITIAPVPAKTTISKGSPVDLRLIIRNTSDRSCARDLGADLQELRIVQGAETIWSSDRCGASKGSDVQTLGPGAKREYMITWNGHGSSKCSGGVPYGPIPDAGQYQLLARLGTKHSDPVKITIR